MKKYVLLVVLISLVSYNLICNEERKVSELVLANVEALARGESDGCPNGCVSNGDGCACNGIYVSIWKEYHW